MARDIPMNQQLLWQPPDLDTFAKAVYATQGSAGCDFWSGEEIRFLPLAAVCHLHRLTWRWHEAAMAPTAFTFGRQAKR